ncbi:hypothetical protein OEA22_09935 [Lacticaseibacillus paracasei]|uniref:Uncharacterized protein n=2 Tax=Lacticaseibacillus paracasei TaxID=1597 RepID=A0AB38Q3I0_LACPA|nr:hypothetical protein [Lacticaseibacillus paracasei]EPC39076.1 hypothetical protein Lpp229_16037 [Lacticaseibacillus paracasei subsp. paracasei Lpp229]EPC68651.1 hypothetical protein Lpp228_02109 [Lacticaseibacillus paracasei subsp. paracasei Lpp228]AEA55603.1 hypothetical protein LCBD_0103 [Lacticaseibacillus paracasei]AZP97516.1 hypothetical protein CYL78_00975 [Lacticaseibacillus paracasei subsp. tolerans]EPC59019.1 hypothetical protein Lpp189_08235 [Lacticaseibacillus paracasei subsp. pa
MRTNLKLLARNPGVIFEQSQSNKKAVIVAVQNRLNNDDTGFFTE